MASISPPLPLSTRSMQAQARPDRHSHDKNLTKRQPSLLDKVLAVWNAPYKKMAGSFLRF
ncbi:hypothetical protein SAMN04515617_106114 [Collimonas sp. OK242]|jgi:hypothetical protein|uniref:hypothetical protein n=1 Tax=Collimonas sp. OK242 TaxID=1798195 RepID=UPI0008959957|nr:hypothetical protein [Collimonas sp. OK242]SDX73108.1 hypothetical protein SAMN04515617_106114 [Collimonas sp. OK242]